MTLCPGCLGLVGVGSVQAGSGSDSLMFLSQHSFSPCFLSLEAPGVLRAGKRSAPSARCTEWFPELRARGISSLACWARAS